MQRPEILRVSLLATCVATGCVDLSRPPALAIDRADAAPTRTDAAPTRTDARPTGTDAPQTGADAPPTGGDAGPTRDTQAPRDIARPDRALDAATPAGCNTFWETTFDSDPTKQDANRDGEPDFDRRGGRAFDAATLAGGAWNAPGDHALDTNPPNPFDGRTLIDVRFRHTGQVSASGIGAVFWINVAQSSPRFSAVWANLTLSSGRQKLALYGKVGMTTTTLATFDGLPDAFVRLQLDIDPRGRTLRANVQGVSFDASFPLTDPPTPDRFATVLAWPDSTGAVFDYLSVRTCTPSI